MEMNDIPHEEASFWLFNKHQLTNRLAYLISQENAPEKKFTADWLDYMGSLDYTLALRGLNLD